jgi:hypothetical protein
MKSRTRLVHGTPAGDRLTEAGSGIGDGSRDRNGNANRMLCQLSQLVSDIRIFPHSLRQYDLRRQNAAHLLRRGNMHAARRSLNLRTPLQRGLATPSSSKTAFSKALADGPTLDDFISGDSTGRVVLGNTRG